MMFKIQQVSVLSNTVTQYRHSINTVWAMCRNASRGLIYPSLGSQLTLFLSLPARRNSPLRTIQDSWFIPDSRFTAHSLSLPARRAPPLPRNSLLRTIQDSWFIPDSQFTGISRLTRSLSLSASFWRKRELINSVHNYILMVHCLMLEYYHFCTIF